MGYSMETLTESMHVMGWFFTVAEKVKDIDFSTLLVDVQKVCSVTDSEVM